MIRIRQAIASEAKPLVGLYARSGAGKTKSALLLACGFVGGDMSRVCMIETESGRGEAYASDPVVGGYQVISLRESFAPKHYGEAISEAEKAGMEALIIDSASHEWEGVGGVLAMAAKNQEDGLKGPLVWQRPKIDHQREFMLKVTQSPIPLVVMAMRARYPMYQVTPKDLERWELAGRPGGDKSKPKVGDWARDWMLEPKQSEDVLYEMFVHGWIDNDHRLHVTKTTLDEMAAIFIDGEPITTATGERLAAWANRAKDSEPITAEQIFILETAAKERGIPPERLLAKAHVAFLGELPRVDYSRALEWIYRQPSRPGIGAPQHDKTS